MVEKLKFFLTDALRRVDPILLACTTVLSVISLLTVYGAVDNFGIFQYKIAFLFSLLSYLFSGKVAGERLEKSEE